MGQNKTASLLWCAHGSTSSSDPRMECLPASTPSRRCTTMATTMVTTAGCLSKVADRMVLGTSRCATTQATAGMITGPSTLVRRIICPMVRIGTMLTCQQVCIDTKLASGLTTCAHTLVRTEAAIETCAHGATATHGSGQQRHGTTCAPREWGHGSQHLSTVARSVARVTTFVTRSKERWPGAAQPATAAAKAGRGTVVPERWVSTEGTPVSSPHDTKRLPRSLHANLFGVHNKLVHSRFTTNPLPTLRFGPQQYLPSWCPLTSTVMERQTLPWLVVVDGGPSLLRLPQNPGDHIV